MSAFLIRAPYPAIQTTTLLPAPKWDDSKSLKSGVISQRSMNGKLYTYVKTREGKKGFQWDFEIARNKALELREFINAYQGSLIEVIDHDGDRWIGYLMNNPFEFTGAGRAGPYWPGGETMSVRLEFEER